MVVITSRASSGAMATKRTRPDAPATTRQQRIEWRIERIAWCVMALLLLASLLGAFGYGPISKTKLGQAGTFTVEYERLQRSSAPSEWMLQTAPSLVREGTLRVRVDASLIEAMNIDAVTPEPRSVVAGDGYTEFVFDVAPGAGEVHVRFDYRPATFGRSRGSIAVAGAPPVRVDQFVYP